MEVNGYDHSDIDPESIPEEEDGNTSDINRTDDEKLATVSGASNIQTDDEKNESELTQTSETDEEKMVRP